MRIPKTPPNLKEQLLKIGEKNLLTEFFQLGAELAKDPTSYHHWDKFRHRVSRTSKLTAEEQWAALGFARQGNFQELPFSDTKGQPFRFFLTQKSFQSIHEIDRHGGGGLSLPREIKNSDTKDRYYFSSLIQESLTSSQIEGAVVTRAEAREMVRENRKPMSRDEQMVLNNYETMKKIQVWKQQTLTPELILEIHRAMTAGTLESPLHEGSFRTTNTIKIFDDETGEEIHAPPNYKEIPQQIQALCDFANESNMKGFLHPVIRAIVVHFWLAYLHPFQDGNGRTSRALFYWTMLKNDFWLFEFISISGEIKKAPKKYYRAFLHTETDGGDLNYFIHHQLDMIKQGINALLKYIEKQRAEYSQVQGMLGSKTSLNHRQIALLKHALKHPHATYTVVSHQNSHHIANQTARMDLVGLESYNLLTSRKVSKSKVFQPINELGSALQML